MSRSRWGGFKRGWGRYKNFWSSLRSEKAVTESIEAPTSIEEFNYKNAQGIWNLNSTVNFRGVLDANPTYQVQPSTTSINEDPSDFVTFTVTTTGVADGTTLYWTSSGTAGSSDFTDGQTSGSFTINSGSGQFSRSAEADQTTEGSETFTVQIRTGSTGGTVVATSSTTTINDTSQTPAALYNFTSHTFTNAGQTGPTGPSLSQCQSAYSGQAFLNGYFSVSNGIQSWTVPESGMYSFDVIGASGGNGYVGSKRGGYPARCQGVVYLTEGHTIEILVGQQGAEGGGSCSGAGGSGGGGTFVRNATTGSWYFVAGGGGGAAYLSDNVNQDASLTTSGRDSKGSSGTISGGTNGSGGARGTGCVPGGGGGGGISGDGESSGGPGGASYMSGAVQGAGGDGGHRDGGFGGGGSSGQYTGGGGGGYSGGAGGGLPSCSCASLYAGGGGGSYAIGNGSITLYQFATHGSCTITKL